MFNITYLYNRIFDVNIPIRAIVVLVNIPIMILWYIAFVYNDFLCINPISYEMFVYIYLLYLYLNIYFYCDYPHL
uniref:Uncharacterized protein n=1 Tax=Nitzschia sp. NIES-3581 TaxID=2083274 RepID=A0A2Z5ZBF1_9STRA|nr:hypothetical protein [Nitzschia sp. NIES-3581]